MVGVELLLIPGGSFIMGSPEDEPDRLEDEGPQHQVTLSSYWMGKYPVTQAEYEAVMGENPSHFRADHHPVESLLWDEVMEFCRRLSTLKGATYRLPSEAEWEYACRAGTTTPFSFGYRIIQEMANYNGKVSCQQSPTAASRNQTTPVGQFQPNAFGLYDMHGNVWEWCLDHWHDNYQEAPTDGRAWLNKENFGSRVLRGGAWYSRPQYCRSASRNMLHLPRYRNNGFGFRVVCEAPGLANAGE
ncbi:MAG: formylglycine-generating enzyme family protein [Nodosilinea sp.]